MRDKCRLIACSLNEFRFILEEGKEQFESGIFLHTLSRLVKGCLVSPWQAVGVWGVSLLSEFNTSLSRDISKSDFMFLGTLWGEKTKTLHNLLNSLRSLACASWINQNLETPCLWVPCHVISHKIKLTLWQAQATLWKLPSSIYLAMVKLSLKKYIIQYMPITFIHHLCKAQNVCLKY